MPPEQSFVDDPDSTREAIMEATYTALCEHGYADLTIQRIADEFPKSKSLLYHHYDGKDELLLDFLEFMLDRFEENVVCDEDLDARDRLDAVFDHVLAVDLPEDREAFTSAMIELRSQAAHDGDYEAYFTRSDRVFRQRLERIVEAGIEEGAFRDVDVGRVASFLQTVIVGSMTQRATAESDDALRATRAELDEYVHFRLLAGRR
jgi:AcrR family transcriptional regulator